MESVVRKIRNFIVKIKIQEFEEIRRGTRGVGDTLVLVCVTSTNPLPRHFVTWQNIGLALKIKI